jgi:hypothetical protein
MSYWLVDGFRFGRYVKVACLRLLSVVVLNIVLSAAEIASDMQERWHGYVEV